MSKPKLNKNWCTLIFVMLTLGLITGCADHVSDRSGTQLDIVPVTYSIDIIITSDKQSKANEKLTEFTDKHWQIIVNQGAIITWQTQTGKNLAQQYYAQLTSRGVNTSHLILTQVNTELKDSLEQEKTNAEYFDLQVKTTVHKIISEACQYPKVGHYDELSDGCALEANRWKSMVHPEKMLDKPLKNTM